MATAFEDEGRAVEEDLVKSFFPSLFDSDSDSEDVYCLRSLQSEQHDPPRFMPVRPDTSTSFCPPTEYDVIS